MNQTPYQLLGEAKIRELVATFYQIMDQDPHAHELRQMHAEDLEPVTEKLADYLIGWMGGPPIYAEKNGSVCMTTPHEPYVIGPRERDQWLYCMDRALEAVGASDDVKQMLKTPLYRVADAVRNSDFSAADRLAEDPNLIAVR